MSLTTPLFELWRLEISWRDLILIGGGVFLLIKATTEIHERVEGRSRSASRAVRRMRRFWPIVAQIVVLDAVFSLDSIITAVGMVDELYVMMAAVVDRGRRHAGRRASRSPRSSARGRRSSSCASASC